MAPAPTPSASRHYKLWIQPNEPGYSDQWYDGVSAIGSATLIAVSGNTVRNIALVGPPSTFTLSGNVTAGGSGLAGATVHLVTGADGYVTSTTTNGSGAYTFSLTPGSYKLWIQPNEPGYSDQWYDGVSAIGSATLIAVSGNTVRNIALVGP